VFAAESHIIGNDNKMFLVSGQTSWITACNAGRFLPAKSEIHRIISQYRGL